MIELTDVVKRFHTGGAEIWAIDGVCLRVAKGALVAVTGASGSGKSTLLHLIGAIEKADAGTVVVGGTDLTAQRPSRLAEYRRRIGFVFQRYHLIPTPTALDNVVAPVLPLRTRFPKAQRAKELLAAVGLAGRENSLPAQLSGGQQQRVAIARALINSPTLLLADEPTGNLDSSTSAEIMDLLTRLRREHNMTVIIATHEQSVAASCERIIRLRDGAIAEDLDLTGGETPETTLHRITGLRMS